MAIGVQLSFTGGTLQQYDQVLQKMGRRPEGPGPAGVLFHMVVKTDDGFRVTDVWRTRDQFDTYAQESVGPLSHEVGLPRPEVEFFDVHNYSTAG